MGTKHTSRQPSRLVEKHSTVCEVLVGYRGLKASRYGRNAGQVNEIAVK